MRTAGPPAALKRRRERARTDLRDRYDANSYRRAIKRGIGRANKLIVAEAREAGIAAKDAATIPDWHPHQLRHNAATALGKEHGLEIARIILGHRSPAVTAIYAEADELRAIDVMALVG